MRPVELEILPKKKRAKHEVCEPLVHPKIEVEDAEQLAKVARVSHHLKVLRDAGIVDYEKRGVWGYYYVKRDVIERLGGWLLETPE